MMAYRFACAAGHEFQAHFKNADSCDKQLRHALVECPYCGDNMVRKLLSAPYVKNSAVKDNGKHKTSDTGDKASAEGDALLGKEPSDKELRAAWRKLYKHVQEEFDDVGDGFPDEARRIHYGEAPERNIYGKADRAEAKRLKREGIGVLPLPMMDEKNKN